MMKLALIVYKEVREMSDWKKFEANVVNEDWTKEAIEYCERCPNRWVSGVFHNCYTEGCQAPDALMNREGHENIHTVLLRAGLEAIQSCKESAKNE